MMPQARGLESMYRRTVRVAEVSWKPNSEPGVDAIVRRVLP